MFYFRYIITYFFFRGNLIFMFRFLRTLLLKREIRIFVQDGFGDAIMGLIIAQNLSLFGIRVKLGLQTLGVSSDPNMNLVDNSGKKLVFGSYTEELIRCFSSVEVFCNKDFYAEGWVYGDIRFFRYVFKLFLGSKFVPHLSGDLRLVSLDIPYPYAVVYLRNNYIEIVDLLRFINEKSKAMGVAINWVLFGENARYLLREKPGDNFIDGSEFSLKDKLSIMRNSSFAVTGRGGFALLPLFFGIETLSYFDEQGMNELSAGLWFQELWDHNSFKGPVNGLSAEVIWEVIRLKYVS